MDRPISHYRVLTILAMAFLIWGVPIGFGFIYLYDYFGIFSRLDALWIACLVTFSVFMVSMVSLWIKRKRLSVHVQLQYRQAFGAYLAITAFGIMGVASLYLAFADEGRFLIHLLLPLFFVNYLVAYELGKKIFKVRLF